jgi:hypothetical protein
MGGGEGGRLFPERVDRGIVGPVKCWHRQTKKVSTERKKEGRCYGNRRLRLEFPREAAFRVGERWGEGKRRLEEEREKRSISGGHVCLDAFHCSRYNMRSRLFSRARHRVDKDFLGLPNPNNPTSR